MTAWDNPNLEPDRDPFTGSMIPCVVCEMSPQVGGTGCCSRECEADLKSPEYLAWLQRMEANK